MDHKETHQDAAEATISEPIYVGTPVNPMNADAMKFIYELGRRQRDYAVQEIEGATYVNTENLVRIKKYEQPEPDRFLARTLTGLVEWLKADVDHLREQYGPLYVSVADVNRVEVLSPLYGEENTRAILASCTVEMPFINLDDFMDSEDFVVMLQTHFCEGKNRDGVLAVAGNLRMEQDAQTADDGVSQRITVRQGVATVGETVVKNPIPLAPHRTFHEVEQPSSPFVLRFRKEEGRTATVALFQADGGAWKIDAITTVGNWLKSQLAGLEVVVIA